MAASEESREFYGHPFSWLLFALAISLIPLIGYIADTEMTWEEIHPALNAVFNGTGAVFLIVGWRAIRGGNRELHKRCMVAAVVAATVFLASYLLRYYLTGSHRYPGDGWDKAVYLIILFSHMILAAIVIPLVARALFLALKGRHEEHKKIARWAWPIWIYVSVTGVIVYLMLYPLARTLYGT